MGQRFSQLLLLTCSLLLVLPPGWCCYTWSARCCAKQQASGADLPKTAATSCCHKEEDSASQPGQPSSVPAKPSSPTPDSCCCEHQPTLPTSNDSSWSIPVFALATLTPDFAPIDLQPYRTVERAGFQTLPLLHLLHCVWLC